MFNRHEMIGLTAASALTPGLLSRPARGQMQAWPNRLVRLVVPFAAGGPTDLIGRIVAEQLSRIWGQQVVIENRGGAGSNIGNEVVVRSDPDGYTVLFGTGSLAVNRSPYLSLSYDPIADLAWHPRLRSIVVARPVRGGKDAARDHQENERRHRRRSRRPRGKHKLEHAGYVTVGSSPEGLRALLKSEIGKWAAVIKAAGIKIE